MLSQGVLVLNKNWVAVHVCSVRRAITLVVSDLARIVGNDYAVHDFNSWREVSCEVERNGNHYIHTPGYRVMVPEVILLSGFGKVPPRCIKFNRRNIYLRDHYTCQYCHARPPREELTIDHVMPRSRGGKSVWENVVLACQRCNMRKANRTPEEANMLLPRGTPKRPQWMAMVKHSLKQMEHSTWQRFVDAAYWNVQLEEE